MRSDRTGQLIVKLPGRDRGGAVRRPGAANVPEGVPASTASLAVASGVALPASHHVTFDPVTHDFVLMLEDVGHHRQADQIEGIGLADAKIAVRALARLNATWWEHPDLLAEPVRPAAQRVAVPRSRDDELRARLGPIALDASVDDVRRRQGVSARGTRALFPWFCERLCEAAVTMSHGDWRGDNLFFTGDPEYPLVAVDWQLISVAKGMKDFTYFVTQSLPPETVPRTKRAVADLARRTPRRTASAATSSTRRGRTTA